MGSRDYVFEAEVNALLYGELPRVVEFTDDLQCYIPMRCLSWDQGRAWYGAAWTPEGEPVMVEVPTDLHQQIKRIHRNNPKYIFGELG